METFATARSTPASYGATTVTAGTGTYFPGIDGLRAVAVLAVMLYHLWPQALPGGFTGVDVFFVISGYVVSASLASRAEPSLAQFILRFYARRMMRILPALLGCLLVTALLTTLFIPDSWLSNTTRKTGMYAFLGLSNYALIWSTDSYFSPHAEYNPFVHTWSLAVEEQFYVVFPFVFFLWLRCRGASPLVALAGRHALGLLWLASFFWCLYATTAYADQAFYLLPSRFWELASGALLFQLQRDRRLIVSAGAGIWFVAAGSACIVLAYALTQRASFPLPWVLLPVAGSCLVIAGVTATAVDGNTLRKLFEHAAFVQVGKLSYSLYLWHWPVYVLFRWTVGLEDPLPMAAAVLTTAALALGSYRLLELPLRHHALVFRRPHWAIVFGGLLAVFISWHLANEVFHAKRRLSLSVTRDVETWYPHPWPSPASRTPPVCPGKEEFREITGATVSTYRAGNCHGAAAGRTRLFVVGDSHAGAYSTMLKRLSDETGMEVHVYGSSGCSFANLLKPVSASAPKCIDFSRASLDDITRLARPHDVVLLASLRVERIGGQHRLYDTDKIIREQREPGARAALDTAFAEATAEIAELDKLGVHVVLEAPKPVFKSPPFRCADWFNADNPVCRAGFEVERRFLLQLRAPVMASIGRLAAAYPSIVVWDPFHVLCPTDRCSAWDGQQPLFFDGDHLSAHGNRMLYPGFAAMLKAMLKQ